MGDAPSLSKSISQIAQKIKTIRAELKMSQEDFARCLGVSFATVNRWENDKATPSKLARSQLIEFSKTKVPHIEICD